MDKTALELVPAQLQGMAPGETDIGRAVAMAGPTNEKVRKAADLRMRFEDEPSGYIGLLQVHGQAQGRLQ